MRPYQIKNTLILALFTITLLSCGQKGSATEDNSSGGATAKDNKIRDTLRSLIDANIKKQPVIDSVFLGFTFSMTELQSAMHYNELRKEKKLVKSQLDNRIGHPMKFDGVNVNAMLAPEFVSGKLYKLTVMFVPLDDMGTDETVYLWTAAAYLKKYRGYDLYQEPGILDAKDVTYHWIKNNLHITLQKAADMTLVSYINMPAERVLNKEKAKTADSAKVQTNKDI